MSKIVDCCTYNGEKELWDIHYNVLKDHVDQFIVVEFDKTFSGKPKDFTFVPVNGGHKTIYFPMTEDKYSKYKDLAESSPNTIGADHWKREFMQKESIKDALTHLKDDDIVFIGDVDEVWNPECELRLEELEPNEHTHANGTGKLGLDVYTYYLNLRSTEKFYGTLVGKYKYIKNECLNHLRSNPHATTSEYRGWHFTSMGGPEALKRKLTDSYTAESYATDVVLNGLDERYGKQDFLGRNFTYTVDESEWPQYLKDNKEKYKHLCLL